VRYAIYSRGGVLEGFGHRTEPRMPAPRATRERLATRAMYLFEKRCHQSWSPYLWRPTTMAHLQSVARVVLRHEGSKRRVCGGEQAQGVRGLCTGRGQAHSR